MFLNIAIILAVLVTALFLWMPKLHRSLTWQAMTTPLASIIGSGFLVLGPILDAAYGKYAPLIMAALCLGAYLYGAAIRYNMRAIDKLGGNIGATNGGARGKLVHQLEVFSSWSLGFAYVISVAYYLNLFGVFAVSLTDVSDPFNAKLLTTAMFVIILFVGWTRGFKSLEALEYVSVSAKLAIIAGLLVGLAIYVFGKAVDGQLIFNAAELTGWPAITLAFGLIVTVQGFETSRYLADGYDIKTRIRSMQWAQWLSTAIYMVYILLLTYIFSRGELEFSETAIVDMMVVVAPVLPVLLVAAALAAQFSAAVADTSGSGGLIAELTNNRLPPKFGYALLAAIGIALTWMSGVFEIISYASRAFAVYYSLQAAIAAITARKNGHRWRFAGFTGLAIIGVMVVIFGQAVEV